MKDSAKYMETDVSYMCVSISIGVVLLLYSVFIQATTFVSLWLPHKYHILLSRFGSCYANEFDATCVRVYIYIYIYIYIQVLFLLALNFIC